jgi:hypothetical protein
MTIRGRVHDGVVVLEGGVRLDEGQPVTVVVSSPPTTGGHSVLDIPTVSVGGVIAPVNPDDDLLGEMLEDRK